MFADYVLIMLIGLLALSGIISEFMINKKSAFITISIIFLIFIIVSAFLFIEGINSIVFGLFHIYPFSMLFTILIASLLIMVNIITYNYSKDYFNFLMIFSFVATGMFIVVLAGSLISVLIGLELMTISTAFLIINENRKSIESAIKLFIMSIMSTVSLTFGIALLLPFAPSLLLIPISTNMSADFGIILLSMGLIIAALSFESSLFPFNLWIPDVYQGAQTYITAMLAGINKKIAFIAIIYILFILLLPLAKIYSIIIAVLAVLTMFFGNLIALVQKNVKRMLAYSSISQAGYIAVGIAAATSYGISASIFQIFAHSFMIIGAFSIVLWLESKNINTIEEYEGLAGRNKYAALSLTIFMLSMIGVPPLIGFVGKFLLFSSAIFSNMPLLAAFAIINSFISIYYYMKVIFAMYEKRDKNVLYFNKNISFVVGLCFILVILLGIYPWILINASSIAATSIL
ncbi:MAG: NADH-quinone oxidoreductase subunit N [Candidatus Micrarchaeia archaeon]